MNLFLSRYSNTPHKTPGISRLYMKLKSRVILYFSLMVILPAAAAVLVIYLHTRSLMAQATYEASLTRLLKEYNYIGYCLEELELAIDTSVGSISYEQFAGLLKEPDDEKSRLIMKSIADNCLSPAQKKSLSAIYITDSGGIRASYGPDSDNAVISDPSSQKWYRDALDNSGEVLMLGTVQRFYTEGKSRLVLCAAKSVSFSDSSRAVVLFDFNHSLLTDFLSAPERRAPSGVQPENTERLILDRDGYILYSRDAGELTAKASKHVLDGIGDEKEGFGRINYNDVNYYMTYIKDPDFNWIFIDLVPVSGATGRLWLRSPLLIAGLAVFGLIFLIFPGMLLRQLKPINDLMSVITDYEGYIPGGAANASLLHVQDTRPGMGGSSDIDFLIDKISSIKLRQKEAELNSLQNQINPHFLYNTLESIRGAALYHGLPEIASMAKSLSLLFRYSISERVLVTVKEELQHLENYISIQNFRFENKFQLQYSIPPEVMNYKILKLTLQPLIENSIKHGLEMKLGKGTIRIEILQLNSNIKIVISDDGLGMPAKKLDELNRSLASIKGRDQGTGGSSGTGIGVMNVNARIKLYFGNQYGLRFREEAVGTTVEITLPAVTDNLEG